MKELLTGPCYGSAHDYIAMPPSTIRCYGDMTGLHPVARIWSTLEAITGSLYIAVLVARLVSLYRN